MGYPAYVSLRTPPPFASATRRTNHGPLGVAVPATDRKAKTWRGTVIRRDPATYQSQQTVGIARCPHCSEFTAETNDVCSACRIPLPHDFHQAA